MKRICVLRNLILMGIGLLLIGGCERIQDVIPTEPPNEMEITPLRVTMIYPSDCVGSAAVL